MGVVTNETNRATVSATTGKYIDAYHTMSYLNRGSSDSRAGRRNSSMILRNLTAV